MAKTIKATMTQGRGNAKGEAYNPRHNTLEITRERQPHINKETMKDNIYIRFNDNGRPISYQGGKGGFNSSATERKRYEELYGEGLKARNERYERSRHKERIKKMSDLISDPKTAPLEIIYQIGNIHSDLSREDKMKALTNAFNETFRELRKYSENFIPLDLALHMDEASPHIHFRATLGSTDKYGHFMPNQNGALEAMGFERPDPNSPKSRYNNALISFTDRTREIFYRNCERQGLIIDREVQSPSHRQEEIHSFKLNKAKEDIKQAKNELEQTNSELSEKKTDLRDAVQKAEEAAQRAQEARSKVESSQRAIKAAQDRVTALEEHQEELKQHLSEAIKQGAETDNQNRQLQEQNEQLYQENRELHNNHEKLVQDKAEAEKAKAQAEADREEAEQARTTAVSNLENLEKYQKGLYNSQKSRKLRIYATIPAQEERKRFGKVIQEALPERKVVNSEDLDRIIDMAAYKVTVDYNLETVRTIDAKLSENEVVQRLQKQVHEQQKQITELKVETQQQYSKIKKLEYDIEKKDDILRKNGINPDIQNQEHHFKR